MCHRKRSSLYARCLLIAALAGVASTPFAQEPGILRARVVPVSAPDNASPSLRAVVVVKEITDGPYRPYQVSLSGGDAFQLSDLPLNRILYVFFLDDAGRTIRTVATRIDAGRNPLDLSIDLGDDSSPEDTNGGLAVSGQVSHCLTLDRHVYTPSDVLRIRYRVENLGQTPVTLNFSSAQRYEFVLERKGNTIWQWSADRMFAQALGSLELAPGKGVTYKATLKPPAPYLAAGDGYTIRGYLTASPSEEGGPPPELELPLTVRSVPSPQIDISVGSAATVDGLSGGPFLFEADSPVAPLQGRVEILTHTENPAASIPGYRFVHAVDLMPEVALLSAVTSLKVQMPYDETRLEALNLREENLRIFALDRRSRAPVWQALASEVDRTENRVSGAAAGFGAIGLFAVPGNGLIGDFDANGTVDFEDFLGFAKGFGKRPENPDFQPELDLDGDTEIGFTDFLTFIAHFGETLPK